MENLQINFKPKQAGVAEFIAYLTNSVVYKKENVISLISEIEFKDLIAQKLKKKDFIGASELFEDAKKSIKPVQEVAEVVSKSIRLSFETYLRLIEVAQKKGISLADTIRITSLPVMKNKLDEFKAIQTIDQDKIKGLYDLLQEWEDKKSTSVYKSYIPEFYYTAGDNIGSLFEKFIEFSIYKKSKKYVLSIEVMEKIKSYLCDTIDVDWEGMYLDVHLEFDIKSNLFKLYISHDIPIFFTKYKEFKESIDSNLHKKIDDVFQFNSDYYYEDDDSLNPDYSIKFSGTLNLQNSKLFFEDVDITQKATLNALIYEKVINGKYTNFAVAEHINQVQEALSRNDYDTAASLNEKLATFQVFQEVSNWYGDIISTIAEESNVVTFTIPKLLLMLWEATKDDKSIPEFVKENLQEA